MSLLICRDSFSEQHPVFFSLLNWGQFIVKMSYFSIHFHVTLISISDRTNSGPKSLTQTGPCLKYKCIFELLKENSRTDQSGLRVKESWQSPAVSLCSSSLCINLVSMLWSSATIRSLKKARSPRSPPLLGIRITTPPKHIWLLRLHSVKHFVLYFTE